MFRGLPPEKNENWDQIILHVDPDTRARSVEARITASVANYLDVCLPSLCDNDERRHVLVKIENCRVYKDPGILCISGVTFVLIV